MKALLSLAGLAATCSLCCSAAFVAPALAGLGGIAYVGGMGGCWVTALIALGVAAALSVGVMRYRRKRARCVPNCASVGDSQCVKGD